MRGAGRPWVLLGRLAVAVCDRQIAGIPSRSGACTMATRLSWPRSHPSETIRSSALDMSGQPRAEGTRHGAQTASIARAAVVPRPPLSSDGLGGQAVHVRSRTIRRILPSGWRRYEDHSQARLSSPPTSMPSYRGFRTPPRRSASTQAALVRRSALSATSPPSTTTTSRWPRSIPPVSPRGLKPTSRSGTSSRSTGAMPTLRPSTSWLGPRPMKKPDQLPRNGWTGGVREASWSSQVPAASPAATGAIVSLGTRAFTRCVARAGRAS